MITAARRRNHALEIFQAALDAADPARAVLAHLRLRGDALYAGRHRYSLSDFDRVQIIGAGKAGAKMAAAIESLLGPRMTGGIVNVPHGTQEQFPRIHLRCIQLRESGHPVPDRAGLAGARRIEEIARRADERDLLICPISGGASALLADPAPPVTLTALRETTQQLLHCGATIEELNTVRKHISRLKGGQLARLAAPATVLALLLSDVVGDDLNVIGSAPTVPDPSTFADAARVFEKYGVRPAGEVKQRIAAGLGGKIADTPKPGDPAFARVENVVVGNNRAAIDSASRRARELGYRPLVLSTLVDGETRDVATMHAAIVKEIRVSGRPARPPVCVLSGGETVVTINDKKGRARGKGGRNQEFVLAAAIALYGSDPIGASPRFGPATILSAGSDGIDGPTDAAGAIADERTIAHALRVNRDARGFLDAHDSYGFFEPMGGLLKTGPTGTNVMDIRIILIP